MYKEKESSLKKESSSTKRNSKKNTPYEMIVFSDSTWNKLPEATLQVIQGLSIQFKTLFVEKPKLKEKNKEVGFDLKFISSKINILEPKVDFISKVSKIFKSLNINQTKLIWFSSPAFSKVLLSISAELIVYESIPFQSFNKKSYTLKQEQELLNTADLILSRELALLREKNTNSFYMHRLSAPLKEKHYKKARQELNIPYDIKQFKKPVIGYIGAIDERIDMDLLENTALIAPEYNFVLIGALTELKEDKIAQGDNIYYLGMRPFQFLPNYLKHFDVCMLPFAIGPTKYKGNKKILEFMAGGKPIVTTAFEDAFQYEQNIYIVDSSQNFKNVIRNNNFSHNRLKSYDKILSYNVDNELAKEIIQIIHNWLKT